VKHPRRAFAYSWLVDEGDPHNHGAGYSRGIVVVLARVEQVARTEALRHIPKRFHDAVELDGEEAVPATGAQVVYFNEGT
jgi:hypothetical protein